MEPLQRVLHVEDDESIRMVAGMTLETMGNLEVLSCESGSEALRQFGDFNPQVLLLDVMMPEMDGPATLEALQEEFDLDNVMVLFMTAKVQQEEQDHFRRLGGFDVILKPFDPMTLTDQLRTCWDRFHSR